MLGRVGMQSDVSAVVLTTGEKTFDECLRRLKAQTLPPREVIVVDGRNLPFHRAFNRGIAQVPTDFFVQCDADMLFDPDCIEVLRRTVKSDTGVSLGFLDDKILGTIQAVKLFRTAAVQKQLFPDSINPDSDRIALLREDGYTIAFARREARKYGHEPEVLAAHRPNYDDPLYAFGKFYLLGSKVRHRGSLEEYRSCLASLKKSRHPMADTAIMAFCNGFFWVQDKDSHHVDFRKTREFRMLQEFEKNLHPENRIFAAAKIQGLDLERELRVFHKGVEREAP